MDVLIRKILREEPTQLEGADLLLYNLAYQINAHSSIEWSVDQISAILEGFENELDSEEE